MVERPPRHPRAARPSKRALSPRALARPRVESLEDRTVPSTFTVMNTDDDGGDSLRQAILDANALPGPDDHQLRPRTADHTIALTGGELSITDSLTIAGPGADQLAVSGSDLSRVFSISNTGPRHEVTFAA